MNSDGIKLGAPRLLLLARLVVLAVVSALLWSCNDEPTKPKPRELREGPAAVASTWSPDGKSIAFYRAGDPQADLRSEIRILNLETGEEVTVDSTHVLVGHMDWSPDGEWLAMEINFDIYKLQIASDSLVRLTFGGRLGFYPNWNHDGTLILYDVFDGPDTTGLYTVTPDGLVNRPLYIEARWGDWLGDTDSVVAHFWTSDNCVRIGVTADSTHPRSWSSCKSPILSRIRGIAVSPDGQNVAFAEADVIDSTIMGHRIHVLAHCDSVSAPISPVYCEQPSWSPDSRQLVYSDYTDGALHLYDIVTGQTRRITDVIRPWPPE